MSTLLNKWLELFWFVFFDDCCNVTYAIVFFVGFPLGSLARPNSSHLDDSGSYILDIGYKDRGEFDFILSIAIILRCNPNQANQRRCEG